jgi:chlorite dismutase
MGHRVSASSPAPTEATSAGHATDPAVGCLFMQLHVFTDCIDLGAIAKAVQASGLTAAVYENVNDPRGVGVMFATASADDLLDQAGRTLRAPPFRNSTPVPSLTMLGRTYLVGYERDAEEVLLRRPRERLLDPRLRWAVWYPLRRAGAFEKVSAEEQRQVLREHGTAGAEFSASGHAYDVRLACHGLDANDNDFVIGILGPDLARLSMLVERMRKTVQTSTYLEKLGPFFVGRTVARTGA